MPHISIIVPVSNNKSTIEQCLQAIKSSIYQDYELIVVNSSWQDTTHLIAKKYANKVLTIDKKSERSQARNDGWKASTGKIIVNIDSDVLIYPDTLAKINNYLVRHQEVDALTGLLSKKHPHKNFFSQYKNLYMHYIFRKLPERITFLYGSIYAIRKHTSIPPDSDIKTADDTALGQLLVSKGKKIAFLKDLEVTHLKKYTLCSFIKNDFQIPFDWARIFLQHQGWQQLGKNQTGFAHAPKEQLASVLLSPIIILLGLLTLIGHFPFFLLLIAVLIWLILNLHFMAYLTREKGPFFSIFGCLVTFFDNLIMASAILYGFLTFFKRTTTTNYRKLKHE